MCVSQWCWWWGGWVASWRYSTGPDAVSGLSLVFTLASVGSKYFWVLEAVIFGTLLPGHPVVNSEKTFGYAKVHLMRIHS